MILRCPSCGREGNVSDRVGLTAHKVRCRPCGARFSTLPVRGKKERRQAAPRPEVAGLWPVARDAARMPTESFSAGFDDDFPMFPAGSPNDSQYDMTAVLGGDPDDSQTELPAFTVAEAPSSETEAARPLDTVGSELFLPVPWYYNFIDSWGRLHFFVALGFAAASLSVLGFFLVQALVGGQILSASITALIVGCVGTIAFLLLSLSATALIVVLIDLARIVRHLSQQADRNLGAQADPKAENRPRLSQPIG